MDNIQIHRDKDRDRQIFTSQLQVSGIQATAPLWTRPDSILMATLQTQPGGKNHAGSSSNNTNTSEHLYSTRNCARNLTCSLSLNTPALLSTKIVMSPETCQAKSSLLREAFSDCPTQNFKQSCHHPISIPSSLQ